ncbi:MAG: hypothetical protein RLZZ246_132, partial [Planctomycetota bacterium]
MTASGHGAAEDLAGRCAHLEATIPTEPLPAA